MKTLKLLLSLVLSTTLFSAAYAQTADEIIANYFKNTGGIEAWENLEGVKMSAKVNQGGMEIPIEIVQLKNGKQMTVITFQGKTMKQGVFNGETLWSTNMMTQKAEKSDAESTANMKLEMNDFPDPLLNYKEKGYTVELLGKEDFNGTETFKIKLTKEPIMVDGKEEDNITYYYFDTENYVPIGLHSEIKSGQAKGMTQEITFSDYDVAGEVYMPYTMTQGMKGQPGQPITMDTIIINPDVDADEFEFPEDEESAERGAKENTKGDMGGNK